MTTKSSEGRLGIRRKLYYYLKVLDQRTGEEIARLVDIHFSGMLLISEQELKVDEQMDLRLEIEDVHLKHSPGNLDVQVLTRWSKQDVNPAYFVTGVQFVNVTSSQEKLIGELIQAIGFRD